MTSVYGLTSGLLPAFCLYNYRKLDEELGRIVNIRFQLLFSGRTCSQKTTVQATFTLI